MQRSDWTPSGGSVPETRRYISEASAGARFSQLRGDDVKTSFIHFACCAVAVEGGACAQSETPRWRR